MLERQILRSSEVMQFRAIAIRRTNSASLRPFRSTMQASKIGERVHHVYHIAVHLELLGEQGVHCCLDFGLTPIIDLKTKRTRLLLHNMQRQDNKIELKSGVRQGSMHNCTITRPISHPHVLDP